MTMSYGVACSSSAFVVQRFSAGVFAGGGLLIRVVVGRELTAAPGHEMLRGGGEATTAWIIMRPRVGQGRNLRQHDPPSLYPCC